MECLEIDNSISNNEWWKAALRIKSLREEGFHSSQCLRHFLRYVRADYLKIPEASVFMFELFRYLRNSVTNVDHQDLIANDNIVMNEVKIILRYHIQSGEDIVLIKIIIQFLVNLVVSNHSSSLRVVNILYKEIISCFYQGLNSYEVLALLYNIHLQNRELRFPGNFYEIILKFLTTRDYEYAQFLAELFLYSEQFWTNYNKLSLDSRVVALELMKNRWIERKLERLPEISIQTLSKKFWTSEKIIFQTISTNDNSLEPYEVSLLLDILGSLCGDETYLALLQKDSDLIIRCGVLLINIHRLGKQSENYFSSLQKLSELKEPSEVIQEHPAFGFKVGLVRLIGNLCWKSRKMQDLARETEIIPVLLDCCNIDARNPLIMQWVILAVRNLCENNQENQAIIAGLHKEGTVSSALVEEMGLTLQDDEKGGIRVVPLDLQK